MWKAYLGCWTAQLVQGEHVYSCNFYINFNQTIKSDLKAFGRRQNCTEPDLGVGEKARAGWEKAIAGTSS